MSRDYRCNVRFEGTYRQRLRAEDAVDDAIGSPDPFAWQRGKGYSSLWCDVTLGGGKSEQEFSNEVAAAVWKAFGEFVEVSVKLVYLESGDDTITLDASDYAVWKERQPEETDEDEEA